MDKGQIYLRGKAVLKHPARQKLASLYGHRSQLRPALSNVSYGIDIGDIRSLLCINNDAIISADHPSKYNCTIYPHHRLHYDLVLSSASTMTRLFLQIIQASTFVFFILTIVYIMISFSPLHQQWCDYFCRSSKKVQLYFLSSPSFTLWSRSLLCINNDAIISADHPSKYICIFYPHHRLHYDLVLSSASTMMRLFLQIIQESTIVFFILTIVYIMISFSPLHQQWRDYFCRSSKQVHLYFLSSPSFTLWSRSLLCINNDAIISADHPRKYAEIIASLLMQRRERDHNVNDGEDKKYKCTCLDDLQK